MTILEALKKSNQIRRKSWLNPRCFYQEGMFNSGEGYAETFHFTKEELLAEDWEPFVKRIEKTFYVPIFEKDGECFVHSSLFNSPEDATKIFHTPPKVAKIIIEVPE